MQSFPLTFRQRSEAIRSEKAALHTCTFHTFKWKVGQSSWTELGIYRFKMLGLICNVIVSCSVILVLLGAWKCVQDVLNSGLLTQLHIVERSLGPFVLLYVDVKGSYNELYRELERVSHMVVEEARLVQVPRMVVSFTPLSHACLISSIYIIPFWVDHSFTGTRIFPLDMGYADQQSRSSWTVFCKNCPNHTPGSTSLQQSVYSCPLMTTLCVICSWPIWHFKKTWCLSTTLTVVVLLEERGYTLPMASPLCGPSPGPRSAMSSISKVCQNMSIYI